eukprot:940869-Pyramimonas_sp.AAC.1
MMKSQHPTPAEGTLGGPHVLRQVRPRLEVVSSTISGIRPCGLGRIGDICELLRVRLAREGETGGLADTVELGNSIVQHPR